MPELPEVETICRGLHPFIVTGLKATVEFVGSTLGKKQIDLINNKTAIGISRRGKYILIHFNDCQQKLAIHLGMTGQLTWSKSYTKEHLQLVIDFGIGKLCFHDPRKFGDVFITKPIATDSGASWDDIRLAKLGPDALEITADQLTRLLQSGRSVKILLMDQALIAGIGNIYANEILNHAQINPFAEGNKLTPEQIEELWNSRLTILERAISLRGSSIRDYVDAEGKVGNYQNHRLVYDRANQPCRNCCKKINAVSHNGRPTFWCSFCQSSPPSSSRYQTNGVTMATKKKLDIELGPTTCYRLKCNTETNDIYFHEEKGTVFCCKPHAAEEFSHVDLLHDNDSCELCSNVKNEN